MVETLTNTTLADLKEKCQIDLLKISNWSKHS
jgi:hypothetical protein